MQGITHRDIQRLRQRIQLAGAPRSGEASRPARSAQARPSRPGGAGLAGEVRETPLGRYLQQDQFYPNDRQHGRFPIQRLQEVSAEWLAAITGGAAPALPPRRWAFVDTETTGLSSGVGTCAFLVGVGAIEAGGFRVRLFFMRDYDEEPAMLQALAEHLRGFDALVTYNGKAYDAQLLENRYRLNRQANPLERLHHFDLLHAARRLWGERMPNCRLGTLEAEVLGVTRRGDVPGALIPQRYFDYLRTGDPSGLRPVLRHNLIDIVSLGCLTAVALAAYAAPDQAALRHGQDLLGLARWLRSQGQAERALQLYRRAVQAGLPASGLFASLWEAAQLERKAGNRNAQLRLLRDLARVANAYRAAAFEELAKHYEHRERDYDRALEMTRNAQRDAPSAHLDHRERRLLRKARAPRPAAALEIAGS